MPLPLLNANFYSFAMKDEFFLYSSFDFVLVPQLSSFQLHISFILIFFLLLLFFSSRLTLNLKPLFMFSSLCLNDHIVVTLLRGYVPTQIGVTHILVWACFFIPFFTYSNAFKKFVYDNNFIIIWIIRCYLNHFIFFLKDNKLRLLKEHIAYKW